MNLEDGDDVFHWPWIYAVQVGEWGLTSAQAKVLREYLLRGGFFMADDLHGTEEWAEFAQTMKLVFPDRQIVEIEDSDAIFHTVYDLIDRFQVPGAEHLRTGYKNDGIGAHWRAIYDDKGRVMGGDLPQFGHRRFLGVGRFAALSRAVFFAGNTVRRELYYLRHDPLTGYFTGTTARVEPQTISNSAPGPADFSAIFNFWPVSSVSWSSSKLCPDPALHCIRFPTGRSAC